MGAMLMKIVILFGENESHITKNLKIVRKILIILKIFMKFFDGGDVNENHHFIEEKRSHIAKF